MSNAAKIMVVDDSPAIVDSIEMMLDLRDLKFPNFIKVQKCLMRWILTQNLMLF